MIDHHPIRENLPSEWEIIAIETGSTTTYLIELISERTQDLSVLYATLMLLGIYEDTGSLSIKVQQEEMEDLQHTCLIAGRIWKLHLIS